MRVKQAAEYANVAEWWLRTRIREGALTPVVAGKRHVIDRLQLDRYMESMMQERKGKPQ